MCVSLISRWNPWRLCHRWDWQKRCVFLSGKGYMHPLPDFCNTFTVVIVFIFKVMMQLIFFLGWWWTLYSQSSSFGFRTKGKWIRYCLVVSYLSINSWLKYFSGNRCNHFFAVCQFVQPWKHVHFKTWWRCRQQLGQWIFSGFRVVFLNFSPVNVKILNLDVTM